jgi:hypothetical protein
MNWVHGTLMEIARAHAGDPGPVVLRRLSNAEYVYTVRDLTGVAALDPAREFPEDSAAGEGFTNAGAALVMSPALLGKYFDAAKEIARHATLLPDGIRFSPHTSERDWTEERLAAIRAFYARFTTRGGGTGVNLQGIKFDTNDGGVLPLEKYVAATLEERAALSDGRKTIDAIAQERALNAKYLRRLWSALNEPVSSSVILDQIRTQWRGASANDAASITAAIGEWQKALWHFTTVGHIGKRDGPKAWQIPVAPLTARREVRIKLPPADDGKDVSIYLVASDAGDGNEHDDAAWEDLRLVASGRPDLALSDVRTAVRAGAYRQKVFESAEHCLAGLQELGAGRSISGEEIARVAAQHGLDRLVLSAWIDYLGFNGASTVIDSLITQKIESTQNYAFIKGWVGADALSVLANSSDEHVRVPGNMKPHALAVHPSPNRRVLIGWRSPGDATLRMRGSIQHAHPECGNGVTWSVELRRGPTHQRLASGTAQGAAVAAFGPIENLAVRSGDMLALSVGPRDGNHSCDLTAVEFKLSDGTREWDLAEDVSPDILAGNPHPDRFGNAKVWNFFSEPESGRDDQDIPSNSLLAKWRTSADAEERAHLAKSIQELLLNGAASLPKDAPDAVLYRTLSSINGPIISSIREHLLKEGETGLETTDAGYGIDAGLSRPAANGAHREGARLMVHAPSVIEVRLPAELAAGCELVGRAALAARGSEEASVQMRLSTTRPPSPAEAGAAPVAADSPIIVGDQSRARKRVEEAFEEFRQLFPAALCYTKIVPVDEVVTLTLFYREDEHLHRLMLSDAESAELDRLWSELHYVSRDALKLVDVFEQLWQFATQDADPSVFEPMRLPIKQRAEKFQQELVATQPAHLQGVLKFASRAWRRPLTSDEAEGLRGLYRSLRENELSHEEALRLTLARVFVAPAFLYKVETPGPGKTSSPVNDYELAARLSYFLWSSAPDDSLLARASRKELGDSRVLAEETRRMLGDARVRRLAIEFGTQWLHTRGFEKFDEKSERHFPKFNSLRSAMSEEVTRFFTDFFQNDRSVLSLLDADHTFVNATLAQHYDLPSAPNGDEWKRVEGMRARGRGGILGFAATLAKQSGASRTSPILRGNWVSETILGERLPRPPKGVPVLAEEPPAGLTERQLTEKHSNDPNCARCHVRIDPFGYALESFDAIGHFRTRDANDLPIDTHTQLADGTEIHGIDGLRSYLLTKRRETFVRQFCKKLLGYALGRSVILSDQPLLDDIAVALEKNDQRISTVIGMIVASRQFREIRGTENVAEP